jgi:hypothetical protein
MSGLSRYSVIPVILWAERLFSVITQRHIHIYLNKSTTYMLVALTVVCISLTVVVHRQRDVINDQMELIDTYCVTPQRAATKHHQLYAFRFHPLNRDAHSVGHSAAQATPSALGVLPTGFVYD